MMKRFRYKDLFLLILKSTAITYLTKWFFISLLIGILVGTSSAGFLYSLDWTTHFRESHSWLIFFLPIAGFFIGFIYYTYGKEIEKGNNLLLKSVQNPQIHIPFKMAPFVYFGTMITHFFGGSAGREGTALQMAGAISYVLNKPFRLSENEKKILLLSAISAGFGSIFGTPFAGAFFAIEITKSKQKNLILIVPILASSFIADFITTKFWKTPHTIYSIPSIPQISFHSIFYTLIAGIFFGLCALFYMKLSKKVNYFFKSKIIYSPFRPLIGGVIIALGVWAIGTTKYIGLGIPTIVDSFNHSLPSYDFASKMLFTLITLSSGFKGGEVTPLFFIGSTLGNALHFFIPLPIGLLAGMGFLAVFSGATKAPMACVIMGIELFGIDSILFISIVCIISSFISGRSSIYHH